MDGADFEEAIFHVRATTKWAKAREDFALQAKELLLPLIGAEGRRRRVRSVGPQGHATRWRTKSAPAARGCARRHRTRSGSRPSTTTTSRSSRSRTQTEPDALCTIFETLNRTGVKLSVFELLTARFWPQNINLRELWDKALADHPVIGDFEVDPYYVLQGISLACRKAPSCKRSDVLNLAAADIDDWWDKVVLGLATGLEILRDDCKVMLPKWLPYQTMLAPLAAVLARAGMPKTAEAGAQREKLKRWFWCAVFGQAYESAPNSKSAKDVVELVPWLTGGDRAGVGRVLPLRPARRCAM